MPDQLKLDVFVAPMRPGRHRGTGACDDPMWSTMSSTLIHGASEAVLVDTPVTNDQVDALVDWIEDSTST